MTTVTATEQVVDVRRRGGPARRRSGFGRIAAQVFMIVATLAWITPILFAIYVALRPISETNQLGYVSAPRHLTFDNFANAWRQSEMWKFFLNSVYITVPAVILTLLLASMVAFVVARLNFKFNIAMLILFTAGNLLPQQVIITPLYRIFLQIPLPEFMSDSGTLYDSYYGIILIHVSFQLGFCVFVLSNYMKTLPMELSEAAMVDGASVWLQFRRIIVPLCRPPLAALATLLFTWIYNDFFWAQVLMQTGDKRPITSALAGLQGQYFTNNNLIAAASLVAALPTLVVYFALQRHFIGGLTLGATKG
jgi:multiple sugar transport system permease protein